MQLREHFRPASCYGAALLTLILSACTSSPLRSVSTADPILPNDPPTPRYIPPGGFYGSLWGTPLDEVSAQRPGLQLTFTGTPAWGGKVAGASMHCRRETTAGCVEPEFTQRVYGGGIEVMAEYTNPTLGYRSRETEVLFYPVYFNFCAHANGFGLPKTIRNELRLCGGREIFSDGPDETPESETAGKVPVYERVLLNLIARLGYPDGYEKRGDIFVETDTDRLRLPHKRRYLHYRWCGVRGYKVVHPSCLSTVTYVYDHTAGAGVVLYATPPLYDYAEAAHTVEPNNRLYAALHDGGLSRHYFSEWGALYCATCRPVARVTPMSEEMQAMFAPDAQVPKLPPVSQRTGAE